MKNIHSLKNYSGVLVRFVTLLSFFLSTSTSYTQQNQKIPLSYYQVLKKYRLRYYAVKNKKVYRVTKNKLIRIPSITERDLIFYQYGKREENQDQVSEDLKQNRINHLSNLGYRIYAKNSETLYRYYSEGYFINVNGTFKSRNTKQLDQEINQKRNLILFYDRQLEIKQQQFENLKNKYNNKLNRLKRPPFIQSQSQPYYFQFFLNSNNDTSSFPQFSLYEDDDYRSRRQRNTKRQFSSRRSKRRLSRPAIYRSGNYYGQFVIAPLYINSSANVSLASIRGAWQPEFYFKGRGISIYARFGTYVTKDFDGQRMFAFDWQVFAKLISRRYYFSVGTGFQYYSASGYPQHGMMTGEIGMHHKLGPFNAYSIGVSKVAHKEAYFEYKLNLILELF